jgi:hypothetical protein
MKIFEKAHLDALFVRVLLQDDFSIVLRLVSKENRKIGIGECRVYVSEVSVDGGLTDITFPSRDPKRSEKCN